jgi:hypothetical protein
MMRARRNLTVAGNYGMFSGFQWRDILGEEAHMGELRYPNECKEYRTARGALLKEEQNLIAK